MIKDGLFLAFVAIIFVFISLMGANDNLIESHDGSRKLYDKESPRTEIYIKKYES
jgi:hypothetical protein